MNGSTQGAQKLIQPHPNDRALLGERDHIRPDADPSGEVLALAEEAEDAAPRGDRADHEGDTARHDARVGADARAGW